MPTDRSRALHVATGGCLLSTLFCVLMAWPAHLDHSLKNGPTSKLYRNRRCAGLSELPTRDEVVSIHFGFRPTRNGIACVLLFALRPLQYDKGNCG